MAFAFIAKLNIEVFQPDSGNVMMPLCPDMILHRIDSVIVPEPKGTIKLLFNGRNHYDLLLDDDVAEQVLAIWPQSRIQNFDGIYATPSVPSVPSVPTMPVESTTAVHET